MMPGPLGWRYWISLVGCVLLFGLWPEIDLWVSGWFYTPALGFYLGQTWWCRLIYRSVEILTTLAIVVMVLLLLLRLAARRRAGFISLRKLMYLMLVLALGPGLLVNTLFKEHWGRARPNTIEQFGGRLEFSSAWVISNACRTNCAFVSGHAAMGFYLVAPALLARRRRGMLAAASAVGTAIGAVRIIQGGHFLSDVVFAFFIVYGTARLLHYLMLEWPQTRNRTSPTPNQPQ